MLLPSWHGYLLAEEYSTFAFRLSWYRMYCATRSGKSKEDYVSGFRTVKSSYESMIYGETLPQWLARSILDLFARVQSILSLTDFNDTNVVQLSNLFFEFERDKEPKFRSDYFQFRYSGDAQKFYSVEFYNVVQPLIQAEQYDVVVLASFKYLDTYLHKVLGEKSHHLYGEDLVNYAFAPSAGALQLKTHTNEQIGLRNFFSGANALLRNPSAHRFVKYDEETAITVVAMVAMMCKLAKTISDQTPK